MNVVYQEDNDEEDDEEDEHLRMADGDNPSVRRIYPGWGRGGSTWPGAEEGLPRVGEAL